MTNLIFELVMAMASDRSLISQVDIADQACVIVTRGPALPPKKPIDLRAMTHIAGGRTTKLIETPAPPATSLKSRRSDAPKHDGAFRKRSSLMAPSLDKDDDVLGRPIGKIKQDANSSLRMRTNRVHLQPTS